MTTCMTAPAKRATSRHLVVDALARGLRILDAFAPGELLGNQELAQRTGLPKATVSRLSATLVAFGYLHRDASSRKYGVGSRILGLGAAVHREVGLQDVARAAMQALAQQTQAMVALSVRDRMSMVCLEVARPSLPALTVNTAAGSVLPLHTSAIGLAYLVAAPLKERMGVLNTLNQRYPQQWSEIRACIEQAHDDYDHHGFVLVQQSCGHPVNAVAAPLVLDEGRSIFTFNCAGPSNQFSKGQLLRRLGPALVRTVAQIRQQWQDRPRAQLVMRTPVEP